MGLISVPSSFDSQPRWQTGLSQNSLARGLVGLWVPSADGSVLPYNVATARRSTGTTGTVTKGVAQPGNILSFVTGNIDTNELLDISGSAITLAVRVRFATNSTLQLFGNHIASTAGYLLYQNGLSVGCYLNGVLSATSSSLSGTGQWAQFAFSFSGGNSLVAVNQAVTSASKTVSISGSGSTVKLGSYNWPGFANYTGDAEYFAVWNRGLSAQELIAFQSNPYIVQQAPDEEVLIVVSSGINLVGAASTQANPSSTGAISQIQILVGATSTQVNPSSTGSISIGSVNNLIGAASTQVNPSSSGAITVSGINNLVGAASVQVNPSGTGAITQIQILIGAASVQVNLSSSGAITGNTTLVGAPSTQVNLGSSGAITIADIFINPPGAGYVWRSVASNS